MKFDITSHVVQNHYKKLTTFIGLRYSLDGRTATDLHIGLVSTLLSR